MENLEWRPIGSSLRINRKGEFLRYEYNRAGEVRRVLDDGTYRMVKLRDHMFQFGTKIKDGKKIRRFIYMPTKGIILVRGDGNMVQPFVHLEEARRELGVKLVPGRKVKGLTAELNWPMPYVVGVDMSVSVEVVQEEVETIKTACPFDLTHYRTMAGWENMTDIQKKDKGKSIEMSADKAVQLFAVDPSWTPEGQSFRQKKVGEANESMSPEAFGVWMEEGRNLSCGEFKDWILTKN